MPDLTLTFDTRQQLASARSACRRMLAAPLHLAAYQRTALSSTLATLDALADTAREVLLNADQQAALATALDRLQHHTVRSLAQPHLADAAITAVAAQLAHAGLWAPPDPQVAQFVRLGYGDTHGLSLSSLDFRIDMPDRATFETCLIDAIAGYNRFTGTQVAAAFGRCGTSCPPSQSAATTAPSSSWRYRSPASSKTGATTPSRYRSPTMSAPP